MIGEEEAFEDRDKRLREQQPLLNNLAATKIQGWYRAHAHRRRLIAEKLLQNSHTQADWDTECPQTESIMAVIAEQQAAQATAYAKAKRRMEKFLQKKHAQAEQHHKHQQEERQEELQAQQQHKQKQKQPEMLF